MTQRGEVLTSNLLYPSLYNICAYLYSYETKRKAALGQGVEGTPPQKDELTQKGLQFLMIMPRL